ncbi:MAG: hypothetical protein HOW73_00005, partial [Polyangiaceae bacterium]|nr:hypothetical protein [Polyangiaceae bacterium]
PAADASAIAAKAGASCKKAKDAPALVFTAPLDPVAGDTVRAMVVPAATAPVLGEPADGIVVVDADGKPVNGDAEFRDGPPASVFTSAVAPKPGTYRFIVHKGGEIVACSDVAVAKDWSRRAGGPQGIPWETTRAWDRDMENLYSAWVEKLFDAPLDESFSYTSLHEITKEPSRNFLHDYLGADEDAPPPKGLRLDPDCADLPYFLRAYFSFKMGLPFSYSACSRGGGGSAPRCKDPQSNLDPLDEPVQNRVRRFEKFLRGDLKNTVHSGTGRTLATDDQTDYYPITLTAETLRPGAVYADPYGHILVVAKRVPQTTDAAGLLFAVDGQPDGTVSRKRFWRGNFLFSLDDPAMGSPGFKRFRPVVVKGGRAVVLKNDAIVKSASYGDYSVEQTEGDAGRFYDRMDDVLSPAPLDPERAMLQAIDALEEQTKARIVSVENGEKHFRTGGGRIDMPNGAAIFETVGDWENFSTPARDLRILIATDVVRGFPALVARRPERFKMPAGKSAAEVVKALEAKLAEELKRRRVEYVRTDESKFPLTLADVLARTAALEMAYNPNDCPEARWGAPDGSPEAGTCKRRATTEQRRKMEKVRDWFRDRKRPARS